MKTVPMEQEGGMVKSNEHQVLKNKEEHGVLNQGVKVKETWDTNMTYDQKVQTP